jgi:L-alanine-DL-glutamate epimerase-like enolase superfamily enzyme
MARTVRSGIESWPLARPFRISRGVKTAAEVVTVEIEAGGIVGRGEAVPYARYGETPQSVLAEIEHAMSMLVAGAGREALTELLRPGAARNAIDCALWDLDVKTGAAQLPGSLAAIPTALTISLDTPEAMGIAAAALTAVPLIKVKIDADDPEACLRAVRAAAPAPRLIVDPNESWTLALLDQLQPLLAELRVDFVEQPLPADEDEGLLGFRRLVPICADESVHVSDDLDRLAGSYDIVNIKLDKTGGLTEAFVLLNAARAKGFGVMVGCMISTSLSIAPALQIAMRADYADLDGPWWLMEDRPGGIVVRDGMIIPPAPGFWGSI